MNPVPFPPVRRALSRVRLPALLVSTAFALTSFARAQTDGAWTNLSGGDWSSAANWSGGFVASDAGADADFSQLAITGNSSVQTTVLIHLDTPETVGEVDFGTNAAPYVATQSSNYNAGNTTVVPTITLDNNGNSTNVLTLATSDSSTPIIYVGNLGTYYLSYAVLPIAANISAVITGTQGLEKTGVGALTLSGNNTFSGGLDITAGTVNLSGTQSFTGGITIGAGGTLTFSANASLGGNDITVSGGAVLSDTSVAANSFGSNSQTISIGTGGATLKASSTSTQTFAYNLVDVTAGSNTGTLAISGSNVVVLTGNNTAFSGGYQVNSGALLFLTNAAATPTAANSIALGSGGSLIVDGGPTYALAQAWLNSGIISTSSTGAIMLTGLTNAENVDLTNYASLYLGASGYVGLGAANTLTYTGTITPGGGAYRLGGGGAGTNITFYLPNTNALTGANAAFFGTSPGGGNIIKLGGSNNYTGGSTVNTAVILAASNALGTGAVTVSNNANTNNAVELTGGVTNSNALTLNGSPNTGTIGTLHSLTGSNIWAGDITLTSASRIAGNNTSGNSLTVSGNISLGSNTLSILTAGGATSSVVGGNITVSGAISGTGGVTMNTSAGSTTFTGSNTYTGVTTIGNTTLNIGNGGASGSLGTGNVTNGGKLVFNLSSSLTSANIISSTGSVIQAGTGATHLTGVNTYTGATTINAGTLFVDGSLASGSAVTVNSGGSLGGVGTVNGAVTFNSGAGLAYSVANVTQSVGLTANTLSGAGLGSFTLYLSGAAAGFDTTQSYSWTVLTSTQLSSITLSGITLDTSGFGQAYTGSFNVSEAGNSLLVNYVGGSAIPEPATYALLVGAGLFTFAFWRRRRARS